MSPSPTGITPDESTSELDLTLLHSIQRTNSRLQPLLDAELRSCEMTGTQFNALLLLRSAGVEGLPMSEIGQRLVVTKSNVTGLVDRLERLELVMRGPGRDRRETVVRLTTKGRDAIDRAMPTHSATLARLTECLSDREKQSLVRLLSKLRRQLRRMKESC